ncbi:hypothetical protein F4775DRAFT_95019 [Biscogniauxia sp. FL1348]|nr:hypothetical protein F4775DRAFT_95019 [Biscogniauxia sp. FL1348]
MMTDSLLCACIGVGVEGGGGQNGIAISFSRWSSTVAYIIRLACVPFIALCSSITHIGREDGIIGNNEILSWELLGHMGDITTSYCFFCQQQFKEAFSQYPIKHSTVTLCVIVHRQYDARISFDPAVCFLPYRILAPLRPRKAIPIRHHNPT